MRLLLSGEIIEAATAESWGLVSRLADDDAAEDEALAFAARLARGPAMALEHIKEVVLLGADLPLDAAVALERKSMHMLFDTEDQREGMAAFLEKRKPGYKGR
jgi:enoyl-CoA hydratase/carnithine racemase